MNGTTSKIARIAAAAFLAGYALAGRAQAQPLAAPPLKATWKGQVKSDRVGTGAQPAPNGVNDLLVSVDASSLSSGFPVQWTIHASTPLQVYFDRAWPPTARNDGAIYVEQRSGSYDLYFEPGLFVPGDILAVTASFADGGHQEGLVAGDGVRWGASAMWCGQTNDDFVGDAAEEPDGCHDWMIAVSEPGFQPRKVAAWKIWLDYAGHDDNFHAFWSFSSEEGLASGGRPLRAEAKGEGAALFFNPALAREGDEFIIQATMTDGSLISWALAGGGSDWGQAAIYHGRTAEDRIGELEAKPNGVNDIQLEMFDPLLGGGVLKCVVSSNGKRWMYPAEGDSASEGEEVTRILKPEGWGARTKLTLDDSGDQAGQFYFISAVLKSGKLLGWAVMTTRTNNSADATWLGQQTDVVGLGESADPDGDADLAIVVRHPLLGISNVKSWKVSGGGKMWGNKEGAKGVSPVLADEGVSAGEKTVRFAEAGVGPFRRAEKFTVTAVLDDGNVINWRLSSPGSPALRRLGWEKPTNTRYAIRMDSPAGPMRSVKVSDKGRAHTWRSAPGDGQAADAQVSSGSGGVTISLDRAKATLTPGAPLLIEMVDRAGVRHYGTCFVGKME